MGALARLGLLLTLLLPATGFGSESASRVFERASPSVYSVIAVLGDNRYSQGSAVVVAPDQLATNHHVIAGAQEIRVRQGSVERVATLERDDAARDLALLRVDGLEGPPIELGGSVRVGQSVFAVGSPRGLELSLSEGIVSSLRTTSDGSLIQTTAPISPGSSGGGLFDAEGRLIGLTTLQARDGQNLNFAVPVGWLASLGVRVPNGSNLPPPREEVELASAPAPVLAPATLEPAPPAPPPVQAAVTTPPATAAPTRAPDATALRAQARRTLFTTAAVIAVLLLLARPAARWLSEALGGDVAETPALPPRSARPAAGPDRLGPFRQQARDELGGEGRDEALWAELLQQAGGRQLAASAAYIEQRAQRLYRADCDRRWAEAQAQSQGPLPPR